MSIYLYAGAVAWILGVALIVISAQQIAAANPGRKIFQLRQGKHDFPVKARVIRGGAVFFLILVAFVFSDIWGYYSVVLILLGFLPDLVIAARHNKAMDNIAA